ncbi:MAG: acetate kinase, partial [Odoribacter sp.]|nr:acetate kinase [Odoribacter sp.]
YRRQRQIFITDSERAKLALEVFVHNVKKYIGAYAAVLNGVDLVIFTGGIGENDQPVREAVCKNMEYLGIKLNEELNSRTRSMDATLSTPDSRTKVMVITTDEELVIAMDTVRLSH